MKKLFKKLQSLSTWHFVLFAILLSELLTVFMTYIMSYIWWGSLSPDLMIIGSIISFVVSPIVAVIVIHYIKQASVLLFANEQLQQEIIDRKRAEEQANELLQQNRELTQDLFQMQEKERLYLARELHDEFGQWLTVIQLNAKNIANLSLGCELPIHESAKVIDEATVQMHKGLHGIVQVLKPTLLEELGLSESIKGLISQWQDQHKTICCELDLDEHLDYLGESLPITVYRLIQESLTNISKHADASYVSIKIHRKNGDETTPDTLFVSIEDDGKGMSLEYPATGFGISSMRERVISEGGEFTLNNGVSGGLCLLAQLQIIQETSG